jgi:integrase
MCRFTLGGALRLSEVTSFRLGDFPDPDQTPWRVVGDKMSLILTHGTKGRRLDPVNAPEAGPPRIIWIPIRLASELLNYRRLRRLRSANLFRKRSGKLPNQPADHFFLGDYDGTPIAPDTLYRAWKTEPLPMAGWHPHSARDYWACTTLQAELERQTLAAQKILEDMPGAWIEEVGRTTIDTVIRPQLGHINIKTTLRYLKWISAVGVLGKRYIDWAAYLEAADG